METTDTIPIPTVLVGEDNPYGADPQFALYPLPERSAGARLCGVILGLQRGQYLRRFARVNLCATRWSERGAREGVVRLGAQYPEHVRVLLGAKVCRAHGIAFTPFTRGVLKCGSPYVILPHPSGRARAWNEPGAVDRARAILAEAGVL